MDASFLHVSKHNLQILIIKHIHISYKMSSQDIVTMVIPMLYNSKSIYGDRQHP